MLTLLFLFRWLLVSALAGITARLIYPRLTNLGVVGTFTLGVVGTLFGGLIWFAASSGEDAFLPCGWFTASIVSLLILASRRLDVGLDKREVAPWSWVYHL